MTDQNTDLPRGFLHDGWWMSPDVEVSLPPDAQQNGATRHPSLRVAFLVALLLVAASDGLFWGHDKGLSLAVFALLVGAGAMAVVHKDVTPQRRFVAMGILVISVLPVIEMVQALSVLFLVLGMVSFALVLGEKFTQKILRNIGSYALFSVIGPVWLLQDGSRHAQSSKIKMPREAWINWVVPVGLGLVFLGLFAEANPLIDRWIGEVFDIKAPGIEAVGRVFFWAGMLCLVWPFMRIRYGLWPNLGQVSKTRTLTVPAILNATAIRNALVLFNLMFAVQTVLDFAILLGGASLPEGMTYAAYAHRGAYPLIATALLAGGFVVLATSFGVVSKLVKVLIYLWIAQNVALVLSSILRLDLYVEIYSLTRLRMAAFIWMGLVAVGLILIVVRVARDKDNRWLLSANGIAAGLVLYICCFVNFAGTIAEFNIARQGGVAAVHQPWDVSYFCGLGHGAAPAKKRHDLQTGSPIPCYRNAAINRAPKIAGWRDWSFRAWRIQSEMEMLQHE